MGKWLRTEWHESEHIGATKFEDVDANRERPYFSLRLLGAKEVADLIKCHRLPRSRENCCGGAEARRRQW